MKAMMENAEPKKHRMQTRLTFRKVQNRFSSGSVSYTHLALRKRLDTADMLRYAMACAAGSVRQEGTLLAQEADVKELLPQVELEIIA